MAKNLTTGGAVVIATAARAILVTVNSALTGTIAVTTAGSVPDSTSAQTIATITNPTVGNAFRYGGLSKQGAISVNPSTTCDVTVTILNRDL